MGFKISRRKKSSLHFDHFVCLVNGGIFGLVLHLTRSYRQWLTVVPISNSCTEVIVMAQFITLTSEMAYLS